MLYVELKYILILVRSITKPPGSVDSDIGKAVPLQAWSVPEGFEEVKVPRLHDNGTGWW